MKSQIFAVALTCALAMTGCGGGGGAAPVEPGTPVTLEQLQGYWTGTSSGTAVAGATKVRAVVLSNGAAWLFLHDTSVTGEPLLGQITATISVADTQFSGEGTRYPASGNAAADITVAGGAPASQALSVTVTGDGATSTLSLQYDDRYVTPAVQADVAAAWHFTKAGGTIDATWTVDGSGALSGTSTLGCTYTGSVTPHSATVAVYDVVITETCTDGAKELTGIARLNTDKNFLTFGLTTTNAAQGEAFAAAKAP